MKQNELEKKIKELEKRLDKLENKKTEYKFKVGDRVQFKTWDEMAEEYEEKYEEYIDFGEDIPIVFGIGMLHLCGTYATIKEIRDDFVDLKDFTADGDTIWNYTIHMLKPAFDEPKTWKFTEDEKVILRNLPKKYEWIARDSNNSLWVYIEKPIKRDELWFGTLCGNYSKHLYIFEQIFQSIKWEDDEPCEFRKFI